MSEKGNVKYRNEIKYLCSEAQLALLEMRVKSLCSKDVHVAKAGSYEVRSVYFDDYAETCLRENIEGVNVREKMRIRIYDGDMNYIRLECKQKRNGMNHKESCKLTRKQCEEILTGIYRTEEEDPALLKKLVLQTQTRLMRPKVIVQYNRVPYVYEPGNVRITFDRDIAGSSRILGFGERELVTKRVLPPGYHIMEVKYDEFLPEFIRQELQIPGLQHTAFSKYAMCRKAVR